MIVGLDAEIFAPFGETLAPRSASPFCETVAPRSASPGPGGINPPALPPSGPFCETLAPRSLPLTVPGPPPTHGLDAEIRDLEGRISGELDKYGQKNKLRNMLLATCVAAYAGVLAAVCSGQKMKELLGCASAISILILSVILSAAFIFSFAHIFFVQSRMRNRAKQLSEQRRSDPSYRPKDIESGASATWWLPRALFLAVLTAVSACLSISSAGLLC